MLSIFLVGTIILSNTVQHGYAQPQSLDPSTIALLEESQSQCICPNTRSVLDILWSCLSTIFLCTWVAVHPNMPGKGENMVRTFLRRVKLMLCAIVGPEMVLMFAMRQWLFARKISKDYKDRGWTMTHGFFLVMGGFVLRRGDEDLGVLTHDLLRQLSEAGEIEFPSVTQEEIEDKSKGDGLSKGLVILQTLWFTIQCVARGVQGLALTELEMVTLAFCSLNAAMYFMWWYKPLDVQCTVPVFLSPQSDYRPKPKLERAQEIDDVERSSWDIARALEPSVVEEVSAIEGDDIPKPSTFVQLFHRVSRSLQKVSRKVKNRIKTSDTAFQFKRDLRDDWKKVGILLIPLWIVGIVFFILLLIIIAPLFLASELLSLMGVGFKHEVLPPGQKRVPTAYSPLLATKRYSFILIIYGVTGSIFGGLHLIAWNFDFPTHRETLLWRSTSLCITSMPFLLPLSFVIENALKAHVKPGVPKQAGILRKVRFYVYYIIFETLGSLYPTLLFYTPARMVLLFEAFYLLRQLPPSALLDLDWRNFIPHL